MSGFVPEQICDTVRFTQYHGDRNISHFCAYASDYISQVINDESIDGAVFPKSCDSTRIIGSYLPNGGKFIHQINVPCWRTPGVEDYFASEIRRYKKAVEAYYSVSLTDTEERTVLVNRRNEALSELYNNLECFSFSEYLQAVHKMLCLPLAEQHVNTPSAYTKEGKRIFLIGSFLSNMEIAVLIEKAGLHVVGDSLPESGRLASRPPVEMGDPDLCTAIAKSILAQRLSPTQNSFDEIITRDLREMEQKKVCGAVIITQQFCEPYDYFYAAAKKIFAEHGISSVQISLNGSDDLKEASLVLEAFAETL